MSAGAMPPQLGRMNRDVWWTLALVLTACGGDVDVDGGTRDAALVGPVDSGTEPNDAGVTDAGRSDAGPGGDAGAATPANLWGFVDVSASTAGTSLTASHFAVPGSGLPPRYVGCDALMRVGDCAFVRCDFEPEQLSAGVLELAGRRGRLARVAPSDGDGTYLWQSRFIDELSLRPQRAQPSVVVRHGGTLPV